MASRQSGQLTDDLSHVEFETSEDVEVLTTFDTMHLKEDLIRGIYSYGFERPSAIQQRAIKPMIKGRDVIAQAQSGTGKTATFSIAMLQSIDTQLRDTQVLCLSPTRELAVQIQKVCFCRISTRHLIVFFYFYIILIYLTFNISLNLVNAEINVYDIIT